MRMRPTCSGHCAEQVVTTEGAVLEVSHENEADLFWALRGAGTAGLGVVTELVLGTLPLREITVCSGVWHLQDAVDLIDEWQHWAPEASRNINLERSEERRVGKECRS